MILHAPLGFIGLLFAAALVIDVPQPALTFAPLDIAERAAGGALWPGAGPVSATAIASAD